MAKRKRSEGSSPGPNDTVIQAQPSPLLLSKHRKIASHVHLPRFRHHYASDEASDTEQERGSKGERSVFAVLYSWSGITGPPERPQLKGIYTKVWDANKAAAKVVHRKLLKRKHCDDLVFFDVSSRSSRTLIPEDTLQLDRNVAISTMSGCGVMGYEVRLKDEGLMKVWVQERKLHECSTESDDEFNDADLPYLEAQEFVDWYSEA